MKKCLSLCLGIVMMTGLLQFVYGQQDYVDALYKTIYFYGAQRCGDTKSWIHDRCHWGDGQPQGVDLSGGWHDCGDHIKFGQTNSYAAALLLLGYLEFPTAYADRYSQDYSAPPSNGIPDILDEVKIQTDYLLKAYDNDSGRVYYQVGEGQPDHDIWLEPHAQSALGQSQGGVPRNGYSVTSGASNYCGDSAAALAYMSIAYRPYDSAYADECLAEAMNYFKVGDARHATQGGYDCCYTAANWADDMAWGAMAIYRANKNSSYLNKAQSFYNDSDWGYWYACYDHVEDFAVYELYQQTGNSTYLTFLNGRIDQYKSKMTSCGYAHYTEWGSMRHASTLAFSAFLYYNITNDTSAFDFGKRNIDFILGDHGYLNSDAPANFSFVIGYNKMGGGFPHSPHHRAAMGITSGNGWNEFNQEKSNPGSVGFKYELTGALVGGPRSACSGYVDSVGDAVTNEVGIDYNAGLVGALGYLVFNSGVVNTPPPPTPTPTPSIKYGDVNDDGKVTIIDALMTAQSAVELNPSGFHRTPADVNCDGRITIIDALMIAQYSVDLLSDLNC